MQCQCCDSREGLVRFRLLEYRVFLLYYGVFFSNKLINIYSNQLRIPHQLYLLRRPSYPEINLLHLRSTAHYMSLRVRDDVKTFKKSPTLSV